MVWFWLILDFAVPGFLITGYHCQVAKFVEVSSCQSFPRNFIFRGVSGATQLQDHQCSERRNSQVGGICKTIQLSLFPAMLCLGSLSTHSRIFEGQLRHVTTQIKQVSHKITVDSTEPNVFFSKSWIHSKEECRLVQSTGSKPVTPKLYLMRKGMIEHVLSFLPFWFRHHDQAQRHASSKSLRSGMQVLAP